MASEIEEACSLKDWDPGSLQARTNAVALTKEMCGGTVGALSGEAEEGLDCSGGISGAGDVIVEEVVLVAWKVRLLNT